MTIYTQMCDTFQNLSKEDHQRCLEKLFSSYENEALFTTDLRDYQSQLDVYTNKEIAFNSA